MKIRLTKDAMWQQRNNKVSRTPHSGKPPSSTFYLGGFTLFHYLGGGTLFGEGALIGKGVYSNVTFLTTFLCASLFMCFMSRGFLS